ncbi:hypothetical protein [Pontimicrobium sp. MEBiC01747]
MRNKINKFFASIGSAKAKEDIQTEDYTEHIIKSIEAKPLGISNKNVIYAASSELGGYYYLRTTIVGAFRIKTFKGASLTIKASDFELILKSDMDELESDFSNVSDRYITNIDFEVHEDNIPKLNTAKIKGLVLSAKKTKVEFLPYVDKNPT